MPAAEQWAWARCLCPNVGHILLSKGFLEGEEPPSATGERALPSLPMTCLFLCCKLAVAKVSDIQLLEDGYLSIVNSFNIPGREGCTQH